MRAKTTSTTCIALLLFAPVLGFAQGPLTPPGAPAPTMKTLDQVEPRTAITNAPFTIIQPGSYYLANNLTGTVTVAANNVTLDLMGYAIVTASGNAITQSGARTNVLVRNGILSAPIGNGVDFSTSTAGANGVLEDLRVTGCSIHGLAVGGGTTIRRCHISGVASAGIRGYGDSKIEGNTVVNSGTGIQLSGTGAVVTDNIVKGNTDNYNFSQGNHLNLILSQIPETLDWPCSVKLVGTLSTALVGLDGITVNADNITIELGGHALIGPGANSGSGIIQHSGRQNLTIRNGNVAHWQSTNLTAAVMLNGDGILVDNLAVHENAIGIFKLGAGSADIRACRAEGNTVGIVLDKGSIATDCIAMRNSDGFQLGSGVVLKNCIAISNLTDGVTAEDGNTMINCVSSENGNRGFALNKDNTLQHCVSRGNGGNGMTLFTANILQQCVASENAALGILADRNNAIDNCMASSNGDDGINVFTANTVRNCDTHSNGFISNSGSGIHASGDANRIEKNSSSLNFYGFRATGLANIFVGNTASGNNANWNIVSGNKVAPIIVPPDSGLIFGDTGGAGVGTTDPHANFTY